MKCHHHAKAMLPPPPDNPETAMSDEDTKGADEGPAVLTPDRMEDIRERAGGNTDVARLLATVDALKAEIALIYGPAERRAFLPFQQMDAEVWTNALGWTVSRGTDLDSETANSDGWCTSQTGCSRTTTSAWRIPQKAQAVAKRFHQEDVS